MKQQNRQIKRQRISDRKFNEILNYFSEDFTATSTAKITKINLNSINKYYSLFRTLIYEFSLVETEKVFGDHEVDESYFGAKRIRGKRGRGASGKTPVFGLLKRNGHVYTEIIENCTRKELMPIIQGKVLEGSTVYSDSWKAYDSLVTNGYKHYRIHHAKNEFARGKNHVNGIESFWSYTKRRMNKFNGIRKDKFIFHLKESEFRFNYRGKEMKRMLRLLIKKYFRSLTS
jgi:transposase-like protein